jgi:hypothetical protein
MGGASEQVVGGTGGGTFTTVTGGATTNAVNGPAIPTGGGSGRVPQAIAEAGAESKGQEAGSAEIVELLRDLSVKVDDVGNSLKRGQDKVRVGRGLGIYSDSVYIHTWWSIALTETRCRPLHVLMWYVCVCLIGEWCTDGCTDGRAQEEGAYGGGKQCGEGPRAEQDGGESTQQHGATQQPTWPAPGLSNTDGRDAGRGRGAGGDGRGWRARTSGGHLGLWGGRRNVQRPFNQQAQPPPRSQVG